jgi:O-antigen/teichoic acid export membrane protein
MSASADKHSLAHKASWGYVWNQGFQLLQFGIGFLMSIIIARYLGPSLQGDYAVISSYGSLAFLLISLGFDESINRYTAKHSTDISLIKGIFINLLRWRLLLALPAATIMIILAPQISALFERAYLSFYFRLFTPLILVSLFTALFESLFMGRLKIKAITIIKFVNSLINLTLVFYLLRLGYGIGAIILVSLGIVVVYFFILVYLAEKELVGVMQTQPMKPIYSFSVTLWLNNGINFILGKQLDVLFLGIYSLSSEQIGYYHVGIGLAITLNAILYSGLFGVSLAALSEAYAKGGLDSLRRGWQTIIKLALVLCVPAFAFLIFNADVFILKLYGEEYRQSIILFQAFSVIFIFTRLLGGGVHITTLYALGRERLALVLRAISGGLNIILAVVMIPVWGVWGALYATAIANVLVIFLELSFAKKIIQGKYPVAFALKISLATILGLIPSWLLPQGGFLWFFVHGGCFLVIFTLVVFLLKPLSQDDRGILDQAFPRLSGFFAGFGAQKREGS